MNQKPKTVAEAVRMIESDATITKLRGGDWRVMLRTPKLSVRGSTQSEAIRNAAVRLTQLPETSFPPKTAKVQFFSVFGRNVQNASPVIFVALNNLGYLTHDAISDWTHMLKEIDGVRTAYVAEGSDSNPRWATLEIGSNPWGLQFTDEVKA